LISNPLKIHETKPVEVIIPHNPNRLSFVITGYTNRPYKSLNINIHEFQVIVLNRDKFREYTDKILRYYLKKDMDSRIKLFSLEGHCFVDF
jgi:hypothetical protein